MNDWRMDSLKCDYHYCRPHWPLHRHTLSIMEGSTQIGRGRATPNIREPAKENQPTKQYFRPRTGMKT